MNGPFWDSDPEDIAFPPADQIPSPLCVICALLMQDGNPAKVAVRLLTLAVAEGECFGLLGVSSGNSCLHQI